MEKSSKIFVAGHRGMVGSAIVRKLNSEGFYNLVLRSWDRSKPNGTPRKLMDVTKIFGLGWRPYISLREGIKLVVEREFSESAAIPN